MIFATSSSTSFTSANLSLQASTLWPYRLKASSAPAREPATAITTLDAGGDDADA